MTVNIHRVRLNKGACGICHESFKQESYKHESLKDDPNPKVAHPKDIKQGQRYHAVHEACLRSWCTVRGELAITECLDCRRPMNVSQLFPIETHAKAFLRHTGKICALSGAAAGAAGAVRAVATGTIGIAAAQSTINALGIAATYAILCKALPLNTTAVVRAMMMGTAIAVGGSGGVVTAGVGLAVGIGLPMALGAADWAIEIGVARREAAEARRNEAEEAGDIELAAAATREIAMVDKVIAVANNVIQALLRPRAQFTGLLGRLVVGGAVLQRVDGAILRYLLT